MAGQPTRMTHVHEIDPATGEPVTVAEAIVRYVRQGNYLETAAHMVGVNKGTIGEWLRVGAGAHDRVLMGAKRRDLTAHQRRCLDLARGMRRAMADAEARDVNLLRMLAEGGIPQRRTVTVEEAILDEDGNETGRRVRRTTTTETSTLPDARVIMWRLARRFPQRWAAVGAGAEDEMGDETDALVQDDPIAAMDAALGGITRRREEVQAQLTKAGIDPTTIINVASTDVTTPRPTDPGDSPL